MPTSDWQFWVVTALALMAGWYLLRAVIPRTLAAKLPHWLPRWVVGPRGTSGRQTRANLTVGGRTVGQRGKQPSP